ncbi:MAG: PCMD domain-containing protein, partial [Phocaeicola sp.]
ATKVSLYGEMKSGASPSVEYKKATDVEWKELPAENLKVLQTSFTAELAGLKDGTDYEWRILVDGEYSETATFTTEKIVTIPNLNFDTWSQSGKNWFANATADDSYWATGNKGVTTVRDATTVPVEGADAYKGKAAKMVTLTGVPFVDAAAGNLFIGTYETNIANPSSSVTFGRPYTGARPTRLKGYYKYKPMPVNHGTYPGNLKDDECHVYIRLWDASDNLFGYGEFIGKETVTQYEKFEFDIKYTDPKAKPVKMSIVASSSHYGGDFEGAKVVGQVGNGSTLWVDEFELSYE